MYSLLLVDPKPPGVAPEFGLAAPQAVSCAAPQLEINFCISGVGRPAIQATRPAGLQCNCILSRSQITPQKHLHD